MQRKIRTKVTYGFVILAFGMLMTDVCRLMRTPANTALAATNSIQHVRKF